MKKAFCIAICMSALLMTACADNKSLGSKAYDTTVKAVATVRMFGKKATKAVKDSGALDELQQKMEEAKAEWERTGKDEAKKKYLEAKAAFEKFLKDVDTAEKEAE
jgi:hypothetical protein